MEWHEKISPEDCNSSANILRNAGSWVHVFEDNGVNSRAQMQATETPGIQLEQTSVSLTRQDAPDQGSNHHNQNSLLYQTLTSPIRNNQWSSSQLSSTPGPNLGQNTFNYIPNSFCSENAAFLFVAALQGYFSAQEFQMFLRQLRISGKLTIYNVDPYSVFRRKMIGLSMKLKYVSSLIALNGPLQIFIRHPWTVDIYITVDNIEITIHDEPWGEEETVLINPLLVFSANQQGVVYKCPYCPFKGGTPSYVTNHYYSNHVRMVRYCCNVCNFESYHKSSVHRHFHKGHPNSVIGVGWLVQFPAMCLGMERCRICRFIEAARTLPIAHVRQGYVRKMLNCLEFFLIFHVTRY